MFPIIWRHLIRDFLKLVSGSLFSLCMLLLLLRAEEIARFAALGSDWHSIFYFTSLLIPHTLPLSIPLALLLSSYLVFNRLSNTGELLALITSGLSFKTLSIPILFLGVIFSTLNGWTCSEWSTSSHLMAKKMKYDWSLFNPLHFLQNKVTWNLPQMLVISPEIDDHYEHRRLYLIGHQNKQWHLFHIDRLKLENNWVEGRNSTQISLYPPTASQYLVLENIERMEFESQKFPLNHNESAPKFSFDHLTLRQLISKTREIEDSIQRAKTPAELQHMLKLKIKFSNDFFRRTFFLLCPITTILIGMMTGIKLNRRKSKKDVVFAIMSVFVLISGYFTGASNLFSVEYNLYLYTLPNLLISCICMRQITRKLKGA